MQAIVETLIDAVYLISVITIGLTMIAKSNGNKQYWLFGIMAVVLGAGDSFHLVPRAVALCTTGLDHFTTAQTNGQTGITITVYLLSALRIILCLFPQNGWLSANASFSWGIYRNIPFALLGLLIIVLFYKSAKEHSDSEFKYMWLTIVLSFGFYIPVVLLADTIPMLGMLMIPKTCAYVWTVLIGFHSMKKENSR